MDGDEDGYVTAREGAVLLGVSLETFYVYVGRHRIRSQAVAGSRQRLYWRQDLLGLTSRRRKTGAPRRTSDSPAAPRGDLRRESALTLLTPRGMFYRGQSAADLARDRSLEHVAALLWNCDEGDAFGPAVPAMPPTGPAPPELAKLPWADRIALLVPAMELANPRSFDLTGAGMARTGAAVIRWMTALLCDDAQPTSEPMHLHLGRVFALGEVDVDLLRRFLVLAADHGFEPISYAVRAVAANGVTPWRSVMTGLLAATGRRTSPAHHVGARQLLNEIFDSPDPTTPILQHLRDGGTIPGFGVSVHGELDPRAEALIAALDHHIPDDESYRKLQQVIKLVREARGTYPTFTLVSQFVSRRWHIPHDGALFLLARAVGWVAHAIEQAEHGQAEHREGIYSGILPAMPLTPTL